MNKEELNKIMNCQCLQSIIQNDMSKHTFEDKDNCNRGLREPKFYHKQTAKDSHIDLSCLTIYRDERFEYVVPYGNQNVKDVNKTDICPIPFLYCPVCGTKSKYDIPKEIYYSQFQK